MSHIDDWCPGCGLYDPYRMHAHRPENYNAYKTLEFEESVQEDKPMSKVKLTYRESDRQNRLGTEIPDGQYFTGNAACTGCTLFVKCKDRIICVESPGAWWRSDCFKVSNYRPVDLEITFSDAE